VIRHSGATEGGIRNPGFWVESPDYSHLLDSGSPVRGVRNDEILVRCAAFCMSALLGFHNIRHSGATKGGTRNPGFWVESSDYSHLLDSGSPVRGVRNDEILVRCAAFCMSALLGFHNIRHSGATKGGTRNPGFWVESRIIRNLLDSGSPLRGVRNYGSFLAYTRPSNE